MSRSTGNQAEELAARYLSSQGYRILDRNVYLMHGELDIVAQLQDELVFVEVKSSTGAAFPEKNMTAQKQKVLARTAQLYLETNDLLNLPARFDVIAIRFLDQPHPEMKHYQNAFIPTL